LIKNGFSTKNIKGTHRILRNGRKRTRKENYFGFARQSHRDSLDLYAKEGRITHLCTGIRIRRHRQGAFFTPRGGSPVDHERAIATEGAIDRNNTKCNLTQENEMAWGGNYGRATAHGVIAEQIRK